MEEIQAVRGEENLESVAEIKIDLSADDDAREAVDELDRSIDGTIGI